MRTVLEFVSWLILLFLLICISFNVQAEDRQKKPTPKPPHPIKVVVLDTGIDPTDPRLSDHLCPSQIDVTEEGIKDFMGHGTHVVGLIQQYAEGAEYCVEMIKFFTKHLDRMGYYIQSLEEAVKAKPDFVNLSITGETFTKEEKNIICGHPEITFVVSAGNEAVNLLESPRYPASLDCKNIKVVGSLDRKGHKSKFNNYGPTVRYFENGEDIMSTLPNNEVGSMTGSSMSTAILTGKLVYEKYFEELSAIGAN